MYVERRIRWGDSFARIEGQGYVSLGEEWVADKVLGREGGDVARRFCGCTGSGKVGWQGGLRGRCGLEGVTLECVIKWGVLYWRFCQ